MPREPLSLGEHKAERTNANEVVREYLANERDFPVRVAVCSDVGKRHDHFIFHALTPSLHTHVIRYNENCAEFSTE
jgi:hypothetical protein